MLWEHEPQARVSTAFSSITRLKHGTYVLFLKYLLTVLLLAKYINKKKIIKEKH